MKLVIIANFRVFVPQGVGLDGKEKPPLSRRYTKGMVVTDVPDGQSADDWLAKGLAKAA